MNDDQLYELLIKNYLLLADGDRHFFSQFHTSQSRFFALVSINNNPGISLTELSERLLCTKGNTTRILQGLEKEGFLIRETDKTDRRAYQLKLTESGQEMIEQLMYSYQSYNKDRFQEISKNEKEALSQLISKINNFLEKQTN